MKTEEERSQEKTEATPLARKKPVRRIAILLAFLVLAISAFLWSTASQVEKEAQEARLPIPKGTPQRKPMVAFEPFLIPLGEKTRYAFISLSFSVELPNGQSGKLVKEKVNELRGMIYDTLKEDFHKAEGIPLVQKVKERIDQAIRMTLPGEEVKEVYFSQFLAL